MGIALALISAMLFGAADFAGGLAVRKNNATFAVVFLSQLVGLATVAIYAPLVGADQLSATDFGWGALAGLCGGLGLLLFYRALALGTMSVVSPVTGVVSAAIPVGVGLGLGERPPLLAAVGIACAIGAVAMFGGGSGATFAGAARALAPAIAAGVGFGTFFSLIAETHHGAGLWPLLAARCTACVLYAGGATIRRTRLRVRRPALLITLAAGVGDVSANALFLYAARHGDLAIVGVIGALYPASTLVLARFVLHERLALHHRVAIVVAACAIVLIASA